MARGMIFEVETLTAAAAEFVTMDFSFCPPPEGCSIDPVSLAGLLARGSNAFHPPSQIDPLPDLSSGMTAGWPLWAKTFRLQLRGQPRV
jgi:hypothetical protein